MQEKEIKSHILEIQTNSEKVCDNKSVGMIIEKQGKILLVERMKPPFGFAFPAGHVDNHGSFEQAAIDETFEETGLKVTKLELIFEGKLDNYCRRTGGTWHDWKIYKTEVEGKINFSKEESKGCGWYTREQIIKLLDRTQKYLQGKISEEDWIKHPGMEPLFELQLGINKLINFTI